MNRQQKKCLIATVGCHLLMILILFVGPGFFSRTPKPDSTQLLNVIPSTAVEAALNSGVKSAQPPLPPPRSFSLLRPSSRRRPRSRHHLNLPRSR